MTEHRSAPIVVTRVCLLRLSFGRPFPSPNFLTGPLALNPGLVDFPRTSPGEPFCYLCLSHIDERSARSGERCPSVSRGGFTDVGTTCRSFYLSSKPRGREKERKMRAISLAEASKIINGTF